jgi:hypothetical protein
MSFQAAARASLRAAANLFIFAFPKNGFLPPRKF